MRIIHSSTRRRIGLALVATLALLATACSGSDDAETITLYSGRTENLIQPILDDFTEETGIEVRVKYDKSAALALLISEEADAGSVQADVFLSQSPGAVAFLDDKGLLSGVTDTALEKVPETVRDSDGRWIGFSGRQRVLVYNTELVAESELPSSIYDLADPAWFGRLGVAPSNSSFQDFVSIMRASEGDDATAEWLSAIKANDVLTYPNNSGIVEAVGRGEIDAGLVNHYYNLRALAENPDHPGANHFFPADDPGAALIVTAAAAPNGGSNPQGGSELIEWLLSPSAQQYFAQETFEFPLRNAAAGSLPAELPPFDLEAMGDVDFSGLGGGLEATQQLIAEAGLEG